MKPLPVKIPKEYADVLGVDQSMINHVNAGRKHLSLPLCVKLLDLAYDDIRLRGLNIYDLRPELKQAKKYLQVGVRP